MLTSQIAERDIGNVTVVALNGQLVLGDGDPTLREHMTALVARGRTQIVLNLHDVTYIDSCGIGTLVDEFNALRRSGGDLKLVCPSPRCEHVLKLTHLLAVFERYESDAAAVSSFAGASDK